MTRSLSTIILEGIFSSISERLLLESSDKLDLLIIPIEPNIF